MPVIFSMSAIRSLPMGFVRSSSGTLLILLLAAVLLSSCKMGCGEPKPETVVLDWLKSDVTINRQSEQRRWKPSDLTGAGTFGRHPWILSRGGREFIWSHLSITYFPVEIVESAGRTLVLDGFPAPSPDGQPQRVEVRIDDKPIGSAEWSGPERHQFPVPEKLVQPGPHRISLHYRYTADAPRGGQGTKLRGMAWYSIELMGPEATQMDTELLSTVQAGPSIWWQYVPTSTPVDWAVHGVSLSDETVIVFWIDRGDGRWEEIDRISPGREERVGFERTLEGRGGSTVRLGVAVLTGAMDWEEINARVHDVPERKPIVLVTFDTTRRDAVGSYSTGARTPNLDRLAAEGLVFDQAYTPTPATGPAHATIFLSRDPSEHGVTTNGQSLPRATDGNLIVQAKALGYKTAAFVSLGTVAADLGFSQGFDVFDDQFDHHWWRFAARVNERALPWIDEHPQSPDHDPGFLWVHYSDPHRPYGTADEPGQRVILEINGAVLDTTSTLGLEMSWSVVVRPGRNRLTIRSLHDFEDDRKHWYILRDYKISDPGSRISLGEGWRTVRQFPRMREKGTLWIDSASDREQTITLTLRVEDNPTEVEARRRYAEEVTAMDAALGELLDRLESNGWLDRGLVLVVSDHGEDLGENGHFGHIHHVGSTLTHVPMVLWGAGLEPRRIGGLVGLIDVAPTLWSNLGLPLSPRWKGLNAIHPPSRRRLYLETFIPEADRHIRGLIELPFRVSGEVGAGISELTAVDLSIDPEQSLDPLALTADRSHRIRKLKTAWLRWKGGQRDSSPIPGEVQERLRSLGYVR